MTDGTPVQEHIRCLKELTDKLASINAAVSDEDQVVILLSSLPDSYSHLVTALETRKEEELTLLTVQQALLNEEMKRKCQALRQWESEALSKQSDVIATDRLTFLTGVGSGQRLRYRILPATEWEDLSLVEAVFCLMKLRHRKLLKMRDTNTMDEFRNKLMDICGLSDRNGNESSSSSVFSSECSGESCGESSNDEQKSDSAAMASAFHRLFGLNIRVHPGNEMYNYKLLTFGDCNNGNDSVDIGHVYGTLYVPLDGALAPVEAELLRPPLNRLVERIAAEIQTNRQLSQSHRNSNSNLDEVDPEVAAAALAAARASELNRILNLFEGVQQYDESCEPPAVSVNADFKRRLDDDPTRYRLCTVECVKNRSGQRFGVPVNRQDDGLNQIQLKNPGSWFPGEQVVVELLDQVQPNGASKGRVLGYYKRQLRYNFLGHQQLQELLAEQPNRFKICTLELNGVQGGSAVPVDPSDSIARIEINGRENCGRACANDQVVVEIMERKGADPADKEVKGRVVGMHQQAEKLRYQLFLCEVLSNVGALMRPLCGTFPKIAYDNSIAQKALKEMPDNGFDGHEERSGTGQQQVTQNRDHVLSIDRDFVSVFSPRNMEERIFVNPLVRFTKDFCGDYDPNRITERDLEEILSAGLDQRDPYSAREVRAVREREALDAVKALNESTKAVNTMKRNKWAVGVFTRWVHTADIPCTVSVEELDDVSINQLVPQFIHGAVRLDGSKYPPSTLVSLVCGLQQTICSVRHVDFFRGATRFYLQPLANLGVKWFSNRPIGKNTLCKFMREMCTEAGINGRVTNHSLRATCATRLYHANVDEQLIMERTGHRSLSALRCYKRTSDVQIEKDSKGKIYFEHDRCQRVNKEFCEQTFLVCFEYWHLDKSYPIGKVVYVLENTDGSLAEAFGLIQMRHRLPRPLRDSKELRNQVANVQQNANNMGLRGRLDMRKVLTVTIDNPDTRDIDDAISYERCYSTGVETVGVHITDICEFIGKKGSPLDRVARGRLRTIYPPKVGKSQQQVTPNHMLPKTLAEDVLSLCEGSDRFCLSVLFKFNRDKKSPANLLWEKPEFHKTIIRSDLRLNKIDVQPVLLETERSADSFGDRLTPDFVSMLRSLWDIARRLRLKRLGEAGFQLQDDDFCDDDAEQGSIGRTFETSCLIEELMVLANLSVGQWLAEQQRPVVARVQDEPRPVEVQNWLGKFGQTLVHMPRLQRDLRGLNVSFSLCNFPLSLSRADYDFIMKYQIGRPRDCVLRLMHDSRHPHMMLALSEWFSVTQPAQYAPTGDETASDEARRKVYHFSLQQANYVHFTSPMRRYPDIVVHRAFRAAINNQQQGPATGETSESLSDLCDSLRTLERRVKMFEKDSMSYAYASRLKRHPQQELVVLRSIDDGEMSFTSSRLRRMPKTLGVVKMSSFGLDARPEPRGPGKFRCKWSRRIFVHSSCEDSSSYNTPVLHYIGSEVRVKRDVYVQRVNCDPVVKLRRDFISSGANYESVRGQFRQLQDVVLEDQGAWMITCENDQLVFGANEQLLVSGKPVQFYREFAVGDIMRLQFRAQLRQGLLTPSVALIEVCGSHTVCVTHKDDPVRCFAEVTDVKSKPSYRDIDEYATIWQRIVAIESATIAASTDDSVILHEVALNWSYHQPTERWLGAFHLPEDFRIKYQLKFGTDASAHDPMIDEKLNDLEGQHGRGGGDSLSKVAVNEAFELAGERDRYSEFLCLRFPGDSSKAASSQDYFTAVAHGGILLAYRTVHGRCRNCNFKRDEDFSYDCQIVVFSLQQHDLSQRFDWSSVSTATVEVMQKFLPIRRQELALWRLPAMPSTSLAHKIALLGSREARISDASYGEKLHQKGVKSYSIETGSEERFNEHTGRTYIMRKRIPCNQAQTDAITDAMKYDLTLIWGPPGTGKTSTGVMLTYWYVFVNRCFDEGLLDADQSDNQDDDDDLNGNVIEDSSAEAVSINYSEFRKEGDPDGSNGSAEGGDDGEWEGLAEALRLSLEDAAEWNHVGTRGRVSRRSTQSSDSFAALFQKSSSSTPLRPKRYNKQMKTDDKELQTRRQVLYCGPSNRSVDVVAEYLKKKLDTKSPAIVRVYSDQLEQKKYPVPGDGLNRKNNSEFGDGDIDPMMREIALHELIRQQQRNPISWIILLGFDELFKRFLAENKHTQRAWVRSLILTAKSNSSFHSYLERLVFELPSKKRRLEQKVMNYTDLPIGSLVTAYRNVLSAAKQRVLQQFEVILCTTSVSCSSVLQTACKFSQIIIDEAGMCTEPETLVPLVDCSFNSTAAGASGSAKRASYFAERLVLIGDHKQLRPIIRNKTAEQLGLGVSLFERHSHRAIMLSYQYRMHPSLCEFSADYFYRTSRAHLQTRQSPSWTGLQVDDVQDPDREWNGINTHHLARHYVFDSYNFRTEGRVSGKLRLENSNVLIGCWPGVRRLTDYPPDGSCHVYSSHRVVKPTDLHVKGEEDRIVFLHVEGVEEKTTVSTEEGSEDSRRNLAEIDEVVRIYKEIRRRCERPRLASESVAVLSQYKYQVISISEKLRGEGIKSPVVKTVNESQGSEFDYVILSLVRSLPNFEIPKSPIPSWEHKYLGFITDANQINVALTRARRGLIIIGNRFLLQANPMWSSLLSSLQSRGCVPDKPADFPAKTGDKRFYTRDGNDPKLSGRGSGSARAWNGGGGPWNNKPYQQQGFRAMAMDFPQLHGSPN
uniref:RNB domain-containing protein n=1 Tax=Macrostomum lignano TaxID=282301 RepID=A0A1I8GBN5_9PLAT